MYTEAYSRKLRQYPVELRDFAVILARPLRISPVEGKTGGSKAWKTVLVDRGEGLEGLGSLALGAIGPRTTCLLAFGIDRINLILKVSPGSFPET